jgi:hypothetical protein
MILTVPLLSLLMFCLNAIKNTKFYFYVVCFLGGGTIAILIHLMSMYFCYGVYINDSDAVTYYEYGQRLNSLLANGGSFFESLLKVNHSAKYWFFTVYNFLCQFYSVNDAFGAFFISFNFLILWCLVFIRVFFLLSNNGIALDKRRVVIFFAFAVLAVYQSTFNLRDGMISIVLLLIIIEFFSVDNRFIKFTKLLILLVLMIFLKYELIPFIIMGLFFGYLNFKNSYMLAIFFAVAIFVVWYFIPIPNGTQQLFLKLMLPEGNIDALVYMKYSEEELGSIILNDKGTAGEILASQYLKRILFIFYGFNPFKYAVYPFIVDTQSPIFSIVQSSLKPIVGIIISLLLYPSVIAITITDFAKTSSAIFSRMFAFSIFLFLSVGGAYIVKFSGLDLRIALSILSPLLLSLMFATPLKAFFVKFKILFITFFILLLAAAAIKPLNWVWYYF